MLIALLIVQFVFLNGFFIVQTDHNDRNIVSGASDHRLDQQTFSGLSIELLSLNLLHLGALLRLIRNAAFGLNGLLVLWVC